MLLRISSVERYKGKTGNESYKVYTDFGTYYASLKSTGIEQCVGKQIDAETSKTADGKVSFINGFTVLPDGENAATSATSVSNGVSDRFWAPFVSNTVAHAIQGGLIKTVSDLRQWAAAAYETAQRLDKGDSTPF